MAQEINLGGTIYISSKRAAEITGYTQDYIGQLARGGQITAQRVSGLWYVVEEALKNYKSKADEFKPTPPAYQPQQDLDTSVSFDGKDYVSAQRASDITGYHADYVGQLARSGKILSRQIGNRWYVDREGLVEHKKHNDSLLAAVQAESVGLLRDGPMQPVQNEPEPHFTYTTAEGEPPLPPIIEREQGDEFGENEELRKNDERNEVNEIPIRVIRPANIAPRRPEISSKNRNLGIPSIVTWLTVIALAILGSGAGFYYFGNGARIDVINMFGNASQMLKKIETPEFLKQIISNELHYRRDSF